MTLGQLIHAFIGGFMRKLCLGIAFLGAVSACSVGEVAKSARGDAGIPEASTDGETVVTQPTYDQLITFNYFFAQRLLQEADRAAKARDISNGILLISGLSLAQAGGLGDASTATTNQLLAALGISEGIRYSQPNAAAASFLRAAEKSSCLASVGAGMSAEHNNSEAVRAALLEVMVMVQTDMRRGLKRDSINVVGMVTSILNRSDNGALERAVAAESKLRVRELRDEMERATPDSGNTKGADIAKATPRYRLLGCLL